MKLGGTSGTAGVDPLPLGMGSHLAPMTKPRLTGTCQPGAISSWMPTGWTYSISCSTNDYQRNSADSKNDKVEFIT